MTAGDFVYGYIRVAGGITPAYDGDYIAIIGLTEAGRQKEVIVIPDSIDGKSVVQIGDEGMAHSNGISQYYENESGPLYKKLYLPKSIVTIEDRHLDNSGVVFIRQLDDLEFLKNEMGKFYLSEPLYNSFVNDHGIEAAKGALHIANVTYMSNDELFWIDNYKDGDKITSPTQPTRDGYVFSGWYKDADFLTEWDFDNDTFDGSSVATTMTLYAKWQSV